MSITSQLCNEINAIRHQKGSPTWEHLTDIGNAVAQQSHDLQDAIKHKNLYRARVAIANMLVGLHGLAEAASVSIDDDIEAVHEHLLNSVDESLAERNRTRRYYTRMGMNVSGVNKNISGRTVYLNYLAEEYVHPNGGTVAAGTWLPAYGHDTQVKFTHIPNGMIKCRNKYKEPEPA